MKTSKIHYLHLKKAIGSTCRVHIFASFERALRSRGLLLLSAVFTLPAPLRRLSALIQNIILFPLSSGSLSCRSVCRFRSSQCVIERAAERRAGEFHALAAAQLRRLVALFPALLAGGARGGRAGGALRGVPPARRVGRVRVQLAHVAHRRVARRLADAPAAAAATASVREAGPRQTEAP